MGPFTYKTGLQLLQKGSVIARKLIYVEVYKNGESCVIMPDALLTVKPKEIAIRQGYACNLS